MLGHRNRLGAGGINQPTEPIFRVFCAQCLYQLPSERTKLVLAKLAQSAMDSGGFPKMEASSWRGSYFSQSNRDLLSLFMETTV